MKSIILDNIRTDGGTQPRAGLDPNTVDRYAADMERGDTFPPVDVFFDGTDYWLFNGFHRVAARKRVSGLGYLMPIALQQGTQRDAILASAGTNATHGLPRSDDDKQRSVERLLRDEEWGKWSDREIARRCKVSPTFVGKIRAELGLTVHVDSEERTYTTRHGTTAVMSTANIGQAKGHPTPEPAKARHWGLANGMAFWKRVEALGLHNGDILDRLQPGAFFLSDLVMDKETCWQRLDELAAETPQPARITLQFDSDGTCYSTDIRDTDDWSRAAEPEHEWQKMSATHIFILRIVNWQRLHERALGWREVIAKNGLSWDTAKDYRPAWMSDDMLSLVAEMVTSRGEKVISWNRVGTAVSQAPHPTLTTAQRQDEFNQQAIAWLRGYQDDAGRGWRDLSDNQTHHANSPCYQAFLKAFPNSLDHKFALKWARARLEKEPPPAAPTYTPLFPEFAAFHGVCQCGGNLGALRQHLPDAGGGRSRITANCPDCGQSSDWHYSIGLRDWLLVPGATASSPVVVDAPADKSRWRVAQHPDLFLGRVSFPADCPTGYAKTVNGENCSYCPWYSYTSRGTRQCEELSWIGENEPADQPADDDNWLAKIKTLTQVVNDLDAESRDRIPKECLNMAMGETAAVAATWHALADMVKTASINRAT
jgi:hypothetical protein